MQYPKLTIALIVLTLGLGHSLTTEDAHDGILLSSASSAMKALNRAGDRAMGWSYEIRARLGDPCAMARVGYAKTIPDGTWYGPRLGSYDPETGREMLRQALEGNCTKRYMEFYAERYAQGLSPYLRFKDNAGLTDWELVKSFAADGDIDARYLIADARSSSTYRAEDAGVLFEPERGLRELAELGAEGHLDASVRYLRLADNARFEPHVQNAFAAYMAGSSQHYGDGFRIFGKLADEAALKCNEQAFEMIEQIWPTVKDAPYYYDIHRNWGQVKRQRHEQCDHTS